MNSKQIEKYSDSIDGRLEAVGFNEKLLEDGFEILTTESTESFIFEDINTKEKVILTHRVYGNAFDEKVFAQIAYIPESNYLVNLHSDRISADGNTILAYYDSSDFLYSVQSSGDSTVTPQLSLPSFPQWLCWMGEVLACGVYCTGIGLIALPAGVVCSVVCGGMFFIACHNAH